MGTACIYNITVMPKIHFWFNINVKSEHSNAFAIVFVGQKLNKCFRRCAFVWHERSELNILVNKKPTAVCLFKVRHCIAANGARLAEGRLNLMNVCGGAALKS